MVYETLHKASSSSPQCVPQLFFSVRKIFELFCSVVPTYHKEALTTLPQVTGKAGHQRKPSKVNGFHSRQEVSVQEVYHAARIFVM